jgi:hypothetical protein
MFSKASIRSFPDRFRAKKSGHILGLKNPHLVELPHIIAPGLSPSALESLARAPEKPNIKELLEPVWEKMHWQLISIESQHNGGQRISEGFFGRR